MNFKTDSELLPAIRATQMVLIILLKRSVLETSSIRWLKDRLREMKKARITVTLDHMS